MAKKPVPGNNQAIVRIRGNNGKPLGQCLACGSPVSSARRKYCSLACRRRLLFKLDVRVGLVQALNARYATFSFSEGLIMMDVLPYGSEEMYTFFYPRTPGETPADDFGRLADVLGNAWWAEQRRTKKRYLASRHVLDQAVRTAVVEKPKARWIPTVNGRALVYLRLEKATLAAPDLPKLLKDAYRREAKVHHPDMGGDAGMFRKIHKAYEELQRWVDNPTYNRRRGFPDRWFYDGEKSRWIQPIP